MRNEEVVYEFDKFVEWCFNCGHNTELKYEYKVQKCNVCDSDILPCPLCDNYYSTEGCNHCPFENK